MRIRHGAMLLVLVVVSSTASAEDNTLVLGKKQSSPATEETVWQYSADLANLVDWWLTPSGVPILVLDAASDGRTGPRARAKGNRTTMKSLDPNTGAERWSVSEKNDVFSVPSSDLAIEQWQLELTVVDLTTGKAAWNGATAGMSQVWAFLQVPDFGLVLLFKGKTIAAVQSSTGRVIWKRDDVFQQTPVYECPELANTDERGVCPAKLEPWMKVTPTLQVLQPPLVVEDSILLFLSDEGPVRVRALTGDVVWRSDFAGSPRRLPKGEAPWLATEDKVYVTRGTSVSALDLSSGKTLWPVSTSKKKKRGGSFGRASGSSTSGSGFGWAKPSASNAQAPKDGPQPTAALAANEHGVLVYGHSVRKQAIRDKFFDLLDPASGNSEWGNPFTDVKGFNQNGLLMDGSAVYVATRNERMLTIYEIKPNGQRREVAKVELSGVLDTMEIYEGDLLITTEKELMRIRKDGHVVYSVAYPPPEIPLGAVLAQRLIETAKTAAINQVQRGVFKKQVKSGRYKDAAVTADSARENLEGLDARLSQFETKSLSALGRAPEYVYFYLAKSEGDGSRSIVEIRKSDGQVERRVQVPLKLEREITYEVDPIKDRVIVQWKNGMFALPFPPRRPRSGAEPKTPGG